MNSEESKVVGLFWETPFINHSLTGFVGFRFSLEKTNGASICFEIGTPLYMGKNFSVLTENNSGFAWQTSLQIPLSKDGE
jgi:hypothetical protein